MGDRCTQAALAEFLRSRQLHATRGNTQNAAVCLRELDRYDEALDLFEILLVDFPESLQDGPRIQKEIAYLRGLVGNIVIKVSEPGAVIIVDGRERGQSPLTRIVRVAAGTRQVRITKPGFWPFTTTVDVAGRQDVELVATLRPASEPRPATPPQRDVRRDGGPRPAARTSVPHPYSVQLHGGAYVGPAGFGGGIADTCGAGCNQSLAIGAGGWLRGEYAVSPAVALGGVVGFLRLTQSYQGRDDRALPTGLADAAGRADDDLTYSTFAVGLSAAFRTAGVPRLTARLSAGILLGQMKDARDGVYDINRGGSVSSEAASQTATASATYAFAAPELRLGIDVAERLELSAGLELLATAAVSKPTYPGDETTLVGSDVTGFEETTLGGGAWLLLGANLGLAYAW